MCGCNITVVYTSDELTAMYPPEERILLHFLWPEHPSGYCGRNHESRRASARDLAMEMPSEELRMNFLKEIAEIQNGTKPEKGWLGTIPALREAGRNTKSAGWTVMRMKIKLQRS